IKAVGTFTVGGSRIMSREASPFLSAPQGGWANPGFKIKYDELVRQDGHVWIGYNQNGKRWYLPYNTWNSRTGAVGKNAWGTFSYISTLVFRPSFQPFSQPGGARHLHKKECIRLYERTCGYSTIWTAYSIIDLHVRCGLGSWMRVRHYPCPSIPSTSAPTGNFCEGCLFFML